MGGRPVVDGNINENLDKLSMVFLNSKMSALLSGSNKDSFTNMSYSPRKIGDPTIGSIKGASHFFDKFPNSENKWMMGSFEPMRRGTNSLHHKREPQPSGTVLSPVRLPALKDPSKSTFAGGPAEVRGNTTTKKKKEKASPMEDDFMSSSPGEESKSL